MKLSRKNLRVLIENIINENFGRIIRDKAKKYKRTRPGRRFQGHTKEVNNIVDEVVESLGVPIDSNIVEEVIVRSYYSEFDDSIGFRIVVQINEMELKGFDHNYSLDKVAEPRNDIKQKISGIIKDANINTVDMLSSEKYDDMAGPYQFRMLVGAIIIQGTSKKFQGSDSENMRIFKDLDKQLFIDTKDYEEFDSTSSNGIAGIN